MHIKRLLSGSLAALMVASSFNVPVVRAAEDEPTKVVEEAKVDTSGDDDVIVDDVPEEETEETTEVSEPEETPVVEEPAVEAVSEETTPEVVVEEAGEQEVVGATDIKLTAHYLKGAEDESIAGIPEDNDGESVSFDTEAVEASVTLAATAPTRTGYTFAGWKLTKINENDYTGTEVIKNAGDSYSTNISDNTTLTFTAQWTERTREITYDVNGGTATTGFPANNKATYQYTDDSFALPAETTMTAPDGKKFGGWTTVKNDDTKVIEAVATLKPTNADNSTPITLYALWVDKVNISTKEITVTGFTYCGKATAPDVDVKDLTIDTDYTVEVWTTGDSAAKVETGEVKDAGNYKVKIIGKGDYTGTVEKEFTVEKKELKVTLGVDKGPSGKLSRQIYKAKGTDGALLDQYALYYNTEAIGTGDNEKAKGTVAESIDPSITIEGIEPGDDALKEKTESVTDGNYTVTRPTNTDKVGKVSITFAFVENAELAKNYKFPTKVEYEIVDPSEFDDSMAIAANANPQADIKDGVAVDGTWKAYTTTYGKLVTKTIPKVDMSKTLTFIRGKRITGNAANLSLSGVYDINGKKLEEGDGKDYTVAITENDKKDTYTAVITFAGNYNGTWTITSPVVDAETASATYEKKITKATFAHDGEVIWVNGLGEEGKAGTEVTIDGKKVALSNAIADLGEANYVGVIPQLNSTISEISVGNDSDGIFDFKGSEIKPTVTLKDTYSSPNTIDPKNYKLSYAGHNKVNDAAKVTVTMNSDLYEGTTSGTFKIVDKKEQVETPNYDITGNTSTEVGEYSLGSKVELFTETPGAQIYYTISSTAADAETITSENYATVGSLYTDAIELKDTQIYSSDITINAIAVKDGWNASEVVPYTFAISDPTKDWGEVVYDDQSQWGKDATKVPDGIWVGDASKEFDNYPDSVAMYDGYAKKFHEMQGHKDGNRVVYNKNYGLRVYYHKTLLTPNDYTIKYANNVNAWLTGYSQYVASKQPTFTITGKGQFTGGFIGHFDIHPMVNKYDYNSETVYNVFVEPTSATSLAEKDKPQTVKVKAYRYNYLNGKKITLNLKENTDYTVAYTDVKADDTTDDLLTAKAGKKRATITFKGNYTGFDTTDYEVVAVDKFLEKATVKIDDSAVVFDGNDQASKVKFSVKLGATELVQDTDFKVTYEPTDKNFLEWREENTTSDYADSEKLMTAGGYQVKLCGIGNYSGTKVVKQTFKGGTAITNSKVKLTNATDIKKITFKQDANVIVPKFEDKTGSATKKLVAGKDYVILYKGNDKVTTSAKAIVLGMGAYSGSKTLTYAVQGIKLSDIKSLITIDSKDYDYVDGYWGGYYAKDKYLNLKLIKNAGDPIDHKGSIIHIPNGTGIDGDGEFDDVDMSVGKNTDKAIWVSTTAASIWNAGKYNIVLEGNPEMGYTGKITVPFVINPVDTENLKLTVGTKTTVDDKDIWTAEYTGTSAAPDVKWGKTGASLSSTDIKNNFTVKYAPNKVAAGQSVKITLTPKAKKNFTGSALTFDYVIGAKSINDGDITVSVNDLGTDGKKTKFGKGSLPVITDGKKKLALNRDYTVEAFYAKTEDGHTRWQPVGATDIMKAGTEIICKITGKGNYNDTTEDMYTYRYVAKANLAKSAKLVQLNKNILYRGEEVTLVKESDFRIQLGTDTVTKNGKNVKEPHYLKAEEYKIIGYANNNKPGTAKVTVQLLGDYGGVKTFNFTIGKVSMDYKLAFAVGKLDAGATVKGTMRTLSNKDGKFTLPMATFVVTDKNKTKYTFDGWYEDENLSTKLNSEIGAKYQVTDIIEPSETKTLYAKYVKASTLKDYTVTFDGNGGMTKDKAASTKYTQDIKAGANVALKANTFVRPGYKFKGWSTSGSAPVEFNNKQKVLNLGTKTLKAVWDIETYTVTFKGIDKVSEEYTVTKQYSVVDPTKTGYTFAGWTVSIAGKVTDKAAKDFKTKAGETVGNIVLTANWTSAAKKATFTVPTTDPLAQNAKLPAAIDIKSGVAFKLPAAVKAADAERVFVGWVDKSDNKVYSAAQSVKFDLTADKAFEAKFADKTYLIKWDLAGGKASNADAYDRYYTNRAAKITTVPSVTKLGYTFKEWTLVDGKNSKAIDPTKADAFKDVKKNVTIRAEWLENNQELTITFLKESGATADSDKATMKLAAGEVKNLDSLMFEKKNYDFAGWKVSAADAAKLGVTETLLVDEAVVSNEGLGSAAITVTLTGTWTPHLYNVTYNLNGAKKGENAALYDVNGKQMPVTFSVGSSASLASSATRTGYDFDGWYVGDAKVATIAVETADDKKTTDVTVTAKWIPKDYTVTLNLDGGTLPDSATTGDDKWTVSGTATHNYTIESGLALPTPTKAHYTFDGWYTESGFKNKVTGIAKGEYGDKELYAKFTPLKKLTITFKDGADGIATQVIYTDDTNVKLTKNAFTKTGNTFKEWKVTSVNGKAPTAAQAKTYEDEEIFTLGNLTKDETLELTAQWTPTT